jgi:small conductance mechanosensitive channel
VLPALLSPLVSAQIQLGQSLSAVRPSPTPTPTPSGALSGWADAARNSLDSLTTESANTCAKTDVSVCGIVLRLTGKQGLGQTLEVILGTPLRLLLIIGFGVLVRRALHRVIDRLSERIATGAANATPSRTAATGTGTGGTEPAPNGSTEPIPGASPTPLLNTRRQARSRTLAQVLRSITTIAITLVVTLMVLTELHFPVTPLLSVASVFGVALGFGAQSLVRDVVSGMFMIVEDQYGVGDVVDVGAASGSVEAVGLRITRLRDVNGTVWYVRNGEILRVGNQSQGWARAVLDVNIGYTEDIDHAEEVLLETAGQLRDDERFAAFVIDEPEVWGVEALTVDGVVMRVVVKTQPLQQWVVARELRRRIKGRFDAEGIEMRTMPRTVIVNGEDEEPVRSPVSAADTDPLER